MQRENNESDAGDEWKQGVGETIRGMEALGTVVVDYSLWSALAKGWMVRVVMIVDRTVTKQAGPWIIKEKLEKKKANQCCCQGEGGFPATACLSPLHTKTWRGRQPQLCL